MNPNQRYDLRLHPTSSAASVNLTVLLVEPCYQYQGEPGKAFGAVLHKIAGDLALAFRAQSLFVEIAGVRAEDETAGLRAEIDALKDQVAALTSRGGYVVSGRRAYAVLEAAGIDAEGAGFLDDGVQALVDREARGLAKIDAELSRQFGPGAAGESVIDRVVPTAAPDSRRRRVRADRARVAPHG